MKGHAIVHTTEELLVENVNALNVFIPTNVNYHFAHFGILLYFKLHLASVISFGFSDWNSLVEKKLIFS